MSIYGFADGDNVLIVGAATSLAEYDDFYARAAVDRDAFQSEHQPDVMTMLTDPTFSRFKKPPYVFTCYSPTQRSEFAEKYKITVLGPNAVVDLANDMIDAALRAQESAAGEEDNRPIGEVLGIDKFDPWDKRSDEQKEKEKAAKEAYKQAYDEAMKKGALSGDSFDAPKGKHAKVTDIHTTKHADGTITIDRVRAVKGLYDEQNTVDQHAHEERSRIRKDAETNFGDYLHVEGEAPLSKRPNDYCYGAFNDVVVITPRHMFKIVGHAEDRMLGEALKDSLPMSLDEIEGGVFKIGKRMNADQIGSMLESAGFHPSEDLTKLMKGPDLSDEEREAIEADLAQKKEAMDAAISDVANRTKRKGSAPAGVISEDHEEKKVDRGPPDFRDANGDNIAIANDGMVSVYFKVEIIGQKLDVIELFLEGKDFPLRAIYEKRDHTAGCWIASVREASMSDAFELLIEAGYDAKLYGVNENGEPLAPEDIKIVDTEAEVEVPIRPWNERRKAWDALTDEEKAENRKTWKGAEFVIVCEYDMRTGCTVLITPRSYFYDNQMEKLYPEPLDLSAILPVDLKPLGDDGWYNTKSRDENRLMHDLCVSRGFIDDWALRLFLNQGGR